MPRFPTAVLETVAVTLLSAPAVIWLTIDPGIALPILLGACPIALALSYASYARGPLVAVEPTRPASESESRPASSGSELVPSRIDSLTFHLERARALAKEPPAHE